MKKYVVAGLGEIGSPISKLLSKNHIVIDYDKNPKLMNMNKFKKFESINTSFLHIAIPVNKNFDSNVLKLNKKDNYFFKYFLLIDFAFFTFFRYELFREFIRSRVSL